MAKAASITDDDMFALRLARSAPDLWPMLEAVYSGHADYDGFKQRLLQALRSGWAARSAWTARAAPQCSVTSGRGRSATTATSAA